MKKIIIFLFSLALLYRSYGQNPIDNNPFDINPENFIPSDFDTFWSLLDGCGSLDYSNAHSCMDSFRVVYRSPFSKYLPAKYYLGGIEAIDSISTVSPSILYWDGCYDSIVYVYALFKVTQQYYSPYFKEIYLSPIPIDIINDTLNDYHLFKYYREQMSDTSEYMKKICIAMTRHELERYVTESLHPLGPILVISEEETENSSAIEFCPRPFFEKYSVEMLLDKEKVARYKLSRYLDFYHKMFQKDFPWESIDY